MYIEYAFLHAFFMWPHSIATKGESRKTLELGISQSLFSWYHRRGRARREDLTLSRKDGASSMRVSTQKYMI